MTIKKFWKNVVNPRRTVYKIASVCKLQVPKSLAVLISLGNRPKGSILLNTYDGSGQAVHPSLVRFQNNLYMALTPYPYGEEWYENPSLYCYTENGWKAIRSIFPAVIPNNMGQEHYSDPCLYIEKTSISLIFRKCERRASGKKEILYLMSSTDGESWSLPRIILEGKENQLISPAIANDKLWCVESIDEKSVLAVYDFNQGSIGQHAAVDANVPNGWRIWHIDIQETSDRGLRGVFMLLKNHEKAYVSKLALFAWTNDMWCYQRDVELPSEIQQKIKFVYKTAFHPNGRDLICSACDIRGRFFLFPIKL